MLEKKLEERWEKQQRQWVLNKQSLPSARITMKETREEKISKERRLRRKNRARRKILSQGARPRLTVFRSNTKMYAQIIDDLKGTTLLSVHEKELSVKTGARVVRSSVLGELLAKKALGKKVKQVVFDKGSYRYHGRVKAFAEGARRGGLEF